MKSNWLDKLQIHLKENRKYNFSLFYYTFLYMYIIRIETEAEDVVLVKGCSSEVRIVHPMQTITKIPNTFNLIVKCICQKMESLRHMHRRGDLTWATSPTLVMENVHWGHPPLPPQNCPFLQFIKTFINC